MMSERTMLKATIGTPGFDVREDRSASIAVTRPDKLKHNLQDMQ